jgi:hypothetical protein
MVSPNFLPLSYSTGAVHKSQEAKGRARELRMWLDTVRFRGRVLLMGTTFCTMEFWSFRHGDIEVEREAATLLGISLARISDQDWLLTGGNEGGRHAARRYFE